MLTLNDPRNLTCHLRFCGQYEDEESGLFYNRHRYYDRETGQYLSTDPLNLSGGFNPYGYVHDPVNWIDPLGLAGCNAQFNSRKDALRAAKRNAGIPMNQHPSAVKRVPLTDINNHQIMDANHKPIVTREYHFARSDGSKIVIQEHSAGHIYGPPGTPGNQGPHFNVRPFDPKTGNGSRNDKVAGTFEHYEY
ncbi:RHS repeat-associated core domain-containing protein [Photorhabdus akhurstii]|uniref:RHS repeat-associated core domain-containing protein n=1 Tax=Photorhabdus akhurstii TaxID=171438 RepID=UPI0022B278C5|nr:RHS repeat-associated core domain-containing protein [Photorhabdus akhurstii]